MALLAMGAFITTSRVGVPLGQPRSALFEAGVSMLWMLAVIPGWAFINMRGGRMNGSDVAIIVLAWIVAIGYGIAQAAGGIGPGTVPPDVLPQIEGFGQYEEMGRRPFASLTVNGMAVVSFLPVVLLIAWFRRSAVGVMVSLSLGFVVGVLSLTRSYLALIALLTLLLIPLSRVNRYTWIVVFAVAVVICATVITQLDPDLLRYTLRLEGDTSDIRAQIWSYTVEQMDPWHWIFGMGFGSGVWQDFLAPLSGDKDLASPHTAMLEVAGQLGLVGLAAYCAAGLTLLRVFLILRGRPEWAAPALAGLLILLREQVATSYVFSPSMLAAVFWLVFGMALGARDLWRSAGNRSPAAET
jgi:hypothetical protein